MLKSPLPGYRNAARNHLFLLLTTTLSIMKKHLLRSALYGIAAAILAACQSRSIQTFPQPDTSVI
ncbi:murein transglycosylase, partial [Neisseria gonorrhoeae]